MDHAGRLRELQSSLPQHGLDLVLVTHLPNIRYLCGFTGSAAALIVGDRGGMLFTDGRYITQAKDEVKGTKIKIVRSSPTVAAAEWLASAKRRFISRLGIEADFMAAGMRDRLKSVLKGRIRICFAPPLIERARMVKDAEEIQRIRSAVEMGAGLFRVALKQIRPGRKEVRVAAAMEYAARCAGAEGMSFSTIIGSGARSAVVHGRASEAVIPRQGFVVCDFGVILAGYCSDRTRTVHVGRPPHAARQIYEAVLEAQQAALDAIRPGVTAGEVDAAARHVLRKWKLARYFTHSTGHGLGLEVHEAPRIAAAQTQKLEPGMVITVEPGAYIPGKWGVRIEDVVVVNASGCEVLAPRDKELIAI